MENATKALIIAAAVLIAIVLISIGVSILSSSGNATQEVNQTAAQMENSTGDAKNAAVDTMQDLSNLYTTTTGE